MCIIGSNKHMKTKDLEIMEKLIRQTGEEIITSSSRHGERVEERIDAMETRIYSRLAEIEDQIAYRDRLMIQPGNLML